MVLIRAGVGYLGKKLKDDREKRKSAQHGGLSVGDSDVAKRAFEDQTTRMVESGSAGGIAGSGTQIRYEYPNDIGPDTPTSSTIDYNAGKPAIQDTRRSTVLSEASPIESDMASMTLASPRDQILSGTPTTNRTSTEYPPPYSSASSQTRTKSTHSSDDARPVTALSTVPSSTSTNSSNDPNTIRIKTTGPALSSGFPYTPALFNLQVSPDNWTSFTSSIITATKSTPADTAKVWAAATATAMAGALLTSVYLGRSMTRLYQEKRVKAGMGEMEAGGLAGCLREWNDGYFRDRGVFVHLELSESAMKREERASKGLRRPGWAYSGEERGKKEGERKFVVVVTRLEGDGSKGDAVAAAVARDTAALDAVEGAPKVQSPANEHSRADTEAIAEMPGDTHQGFLIPELPGDDDYMSELPGGVSLGFGSEKAFLAPPEGYAELEPDVVTSTAIDRTTVKEMDDTSVVVAEKDGTAVGESQGVSKPEKDNT